MLILGVITNAARHEPEAVAALRAGRDDRVTRLLRLPPPVPYVPSRLEVARDRLRTKEAKTPGKAVKKAKAKAPAKARTKQPRKAPAADPRRTAQPGERAARRAGHHGDGRNGRQGRGQQGRARSLEGQRYG
jgi:cell division protein FtsW